MANEINHLQGPTDTEPSLIATHQATANSIEFGSNGLTLRRNDQAAFAVVARTALLGALGVRR